MTQKLKMHEETFQKQQPAAACNAVYNLCLCHLMAIIGGQSAKSKEEFISEYLLNYKQKDAIAGYMQFLITTDDVSDSTNSDLLNDKSWAPVGDKELLLIAYDDNGREFGR